MKTNLEELKNQTIGVEVEMARITRQNAISVIASYFGTEDTIIHERGGYDTWSCKDTQGRKWVVTRDVSIQDDEAYKAEMATPILHYDDIEDLQEIIRQLRHAGAVSNPSRGCGVHIHIGANGHDAKSIRNLVNIMASHEDLLIGALNLDPNRMGVYCKTVDPAFLEELNRQKPATMEELERLWYGGDSWRNHQHYHPSRYRMLNLHATFTKGTIEFRLFQFDNPHGNRRGGLHAGQLKSYIQLCLALSYAAKTSSRVSPKQGQRENKKYAMRTWLLRLGFIGDEFKTARDVFCSRLDGDCSFRSGCRPA